MKFGKSYEEVQSEPSTGNSGYLRYFKNDVTTFRVLQEPAEWVAYWEHFNPGGFPFPCTQDRQNCPGCTSPNEKMKKASRKIAFNVLEGEYVNAYKVPKTVADKLAARVERNPNKTVTDRDYTIYKLKSKNADGSTKTDYDVEGNDRSQIAPSEMEKLRERFLDVEQLLHSAYEEAWGDSDKAKQTQRKADEAEAEDGLRAKLKAAHEREWVEGDPEEIPEWAAKEEKEERKFQTPPDPEAVNEYDESDLRQMSVDEIKVVCKTEGVTPPDELTTTDQIVDWLLEQ